MAVIGHAEVIIRPITAGFESSVTRQLRGMNGIIRSNGRQFGESLGSALTRGFEQSVSNNIFSKLADGIDTMAPRAQQAREQFQRLVRVGYVVQGVLGLLVGGISSLVVSLGTLVGILGKAIPAASILASAFVTLRVAMATAKFGFGDIASAVQAATDPTKTLGKSIADLRKEFKQLLFDAEEANQSEARAALNLESALDRLRSAQDLPLNSRARRDAELAYEEADLAYRRAKDRAAELNGEVEKGQDAFIKKNQSGGSDPFAGLNEAQREFAQYLVDLKPKIDDLELSISKALLPPFRGAVEILEDELYPILERELPVIAGEVGEAVKDIFENVNWSTVEEILQGMTTPFGDNELSNIELFGELIGNILDIFLQITNAAAPLLNDFLTWIVGKTGEWSDNMREMDLEGFFDEAGEVAGDLGEIIGNVFIGIGNLIGLTTGPGSAGEDMIQWMKDGTAAFANMFSEDPEAGKQFFKDAFANAESVLSSIGALLDEILKLADNPNIGEAFDTLKEGAPALGEMLGKMVDAGPSFAEFLKTVTEIANELTDSAQISAFFDTLNAGAEIFRDFVQSESFKRLLDNLGPIFASLSAIGVMIDVVRFGFDVFLGYIAFAAGQAGKFGDKVKDLLTGKSLKGIGTVGKKLLAPAGIVGAIIFGIMKTVEFYDKFVDFRNMVDTAMSDVKAAFDRFLQPLGELFEKIFGGEGGGGLMGALDPLLKFLLELIIPNLAFALEQILNILTFVMEMANNLLDWVLPVITDIGEALGALFEGDIYGFFENIAQAFIGWFVGMGQFLVNSVIDLINFMIRSLNNMVGSISNSPFGDFLRDVLGIDLGKMKLGELEKVDWVGDMKRGETARNISSAMAAGAAGGQSFGGADRLAFQATATNNATNYTKNAISNTSGYQDYMSRPDINITVNPSAGMNEKELAENVSRRIASEMRKGTIF